MSAEANIHAALMSKVEGITGHEFLWPQKGGDIPAGEHVRVYHLPNDNRQVLLAYQGPLDRKGFLVLTLVSPLGRHEVVTRQRAGELAANFPLGSKMESGSACLTVKTMNVKPGRKERERWETPIWIGYQGFL